MEAISRSAFGVTSSIIGVNKHVDSMTSEVPTRVTIVPPHRKQLTITLGCVLDGSRVLFIRRSDPSIPALDGRWELPGGKVEFGEDPSRAVEREVYEETGRRVAAKEMLPFVCHAVRDVSTGQQVHAVLLCFRCELLTDASGPRRKDPKVADARWIEIPDIGVSSLQAGSFQFVHETVRRFAAPSVRNTLQTVRWSFAYVQFESVDRARNRFRDYWLTVFFDLTGPRPFKVDRTWGRIGRRLNSESRWFATRDDMAQYLEDVTRDRRRHGYCLVAKSDNFPAVDSLVGFPSTNSSSPNSQASLFER
jgi:ADP-ribose pyrophosphatase YjhB (NUDIX family)/predicted DNA-binding WGR domain protein